MDINTYYNLIINDEYGDCFKQADTLDRNFCNSFGLSDSMYIDCQTGTIHSLSTPVKFDVGRLDACGYGSGKLAATSSMTLSSGFNINSRRMAFNDAFKRSASLIVPISYVTIDGYVYSLLTSFICEYVYSTEEKTINISNEEIIQRFSQLSSETYPLISIYAGTENRDVQWEDTEWPRSITKQEMEEIGIYDVLSNFLESPSSSGYSFCDYLLSSENNFISFKVVPGAGQDGNAAIKDLYAHFYLYANHDIYKLRWINNGNLVSETGTRIRWDFEHFPTKYYNVADLLIASTNSEDDYLTTKEHCIVLNDLYSQSSILYIPSSIDEDTYTYDSESEFAINIAIAKRDETLSFPKIGSSSILARGDVSRFQNDAAMLQTGIVSSESFIDEFTSTKNNSELYNLINTTLYN